MDRSFIEKGVALSGTGRDMAQCSYFEHFGGKYTDVSFGMLPGCGREASLPARIFEKLFTVPPLSRGDLGKQKALERVPFYADAVKCHLNVRWRGNRLQWTDDRNLDG